MTLLGGCSTTETEIQDNISSNEKSEQTLFPNTLTVDYFYENSFGDIDEKYLGQPIMVRGKVEDVDTTSFELLISSVENPSKWAFFDMKSKEEMLDISKGDIVLIQGFYGEGLELATIETEEAENIINENTKITQEQEESIVESNPSKQGSLDGLVFSDFVIEHFSSGSDDNPVTTLKYILVY